MESDSVDSESDSDCSELSTSDCSELSTSDYSELTTSDCSELSLADTVSPTDHSESSSLSEASAGVPSEKTGKERIALIMAETFDESSGREPRGVRGYATIKDLPNSTSKWMTNEEMKTQVFRVFKARRFKVPVERIPWPYHVTGMDVDIWLMGQDRFIREDTLSFQDYFRDCLGPIDIDPMKWFYSSKGSEVEQNLKNRMQSLMLKVVKEKIAASANVQGKYNRFIVRMETAFDSWVARLGSVLAIRPSKLNESAYEDIFLAFVDLFGLKCWPGDREKIEIPYSVFSGDGKKTVTGIRSKPDLILFRHEYSEGFACPVPLAVVEVKRPKGFASKTRKKVARDRKRSFPKEGENEGLPDHEGVMDSQEPTVKHVKFDVVSRCGTEAVSASLDQDGVEVAPATSSLHSPTASVSNFDQTTKNTLSEEQRSPSEETVCTAETYDEVHYGELPPCAEIPSKEEKRCWNDFLPQLLGEVVATGYLQRNATKNCSMGIVFKGYCMTFLNFACQGDFRLDEIPIKSGAGLDIFISEPLNILKKKDREKICKILLYLALVTPEK